MCLSAVDLFVGYAEGAEVLDFFDQPKEQAFLFFSCVSAERTAQAALGFSFVFFGNHFIQDDIGPQTCGNDTTGVRNDIGLQTCENYTAGVRRILLLTFGGAAQVHFESAICQRREQRA